MSEKTSLLELFNLDYTGLWTVSTLNEKTSWHFHKTHLGKTGAQS